MNTDIRISTGLTSNPKILKLMRRCGDRSFFCLMSLWTWTAQNKPDGNLSGMDKEDIELASKWNGNPDCLADCLIDLKLIDIKEDGGFSIHQWAENNPWAAMSEERSDAARLSRLFRKNPGAATMLKANGRNGITAEEYQLYVKETKEERTKYDRTTKPSTPDPVPAPDPDPTPKDVCTKTLLKDSCAEPQKAEVQAPEPTEPPVIVFPLSKKGTEQAFYQSDIDQWRESFPGVDLETELLKCRQWNIDNPTKRKTKAGIRRHVSGWLGKAQDGQGSGRNGPASNQGPRAMTVRDALVIQGEQIARALNEEHHRQRINPDSGQTGGLLLEHPL